MISQKHRSFSKKIYYTIFAEDIILFMINVIFSLLLCQVHAEEPDLDPSFITVDIQNGTKIRQFTNTIVFVIAQTQFTTKVNINGQDVETLTEGERITYVPTYLQYMKVVYNTPAATEAVNTPEATQARKHIVLHPGILIGCTFGVVFIIGFFYTSCCRKPQHISRPKAKIVNKSEKIESSDSLGATRETRRPTHKAASSGKTGRNKAMTQHGSRPRPSQRTHTHVGGHPRSNGGERRSNRNMTMQKKRNNSVERPKTRSQTRMNEPRRKATRRGDIKRGETTRKTTRGKM
ncbi:hypothetical protein TRFO_19786 [Tritrichomonas foetus]|uniref:Uncharacterized protein n=1 Tax=Tritrichomonas foetus TaxID=1144522 RepID=A0A1J4KHC7_9EUKA|nr:hypothetical protein TRFO_19786 [Tritrichomonas foetus]|eukprot:OHT10815.1 hypothetical protein TRFO_19786 [Tritrichomonas foetus]